MTPPSGRVVGCAVSEPRARECVVQAAAALGVRVCWMESGDTLRLPEQCLSLLVYDLGSASLRSVTSVRSFRSRHPECPVLLYVSHAAPYVDRATRLALEEGTLWYVQGRHEREDVAILTATLRQVSHDAPYVALRTYLAMIMAPWPRRAEFALAALSHAASAAGQPAVTAAARECGGHQRNLPEVLGERPKRFVRHVSFLYYTFRALYTGESVAHVATACRVHAKTLARLAADFGPRGARPGGPPAPLFRHTAHLFHARYGDPSFAGSVARPFPSKAHAAPEHRPRTILLVTTADPAGRVTAERLQHLGYRVLLSNSGPEALLTLHMEPVDGVVMDDRVTWDDIPRLGHGVLAGWPHLRGHLAVLSEHPPRIQAWCEAAEVPLLLQPLAAETAVPVLQALVERHARATRTAAPPARSSIRGT